MYYVAETEKLVADGVINPAQAAEIKRRARAAMVALCVHTLLIAGILAATSGLVIFLSSAVSVAICGGLFAAAGLLILRYGASLYRMFGNASAMIGAGMLISGSAIEIFSKAPRQAGVILFILGASIAALCAWRWFKAMAHLRFAYGAVLMMGAVLHLLGLYDFGDSALNGGVAFAFVHFYTFVVIVLAGAVVDLRFVTALAIIPFAQMLDAGSGYFHAAYVFNSPEPTLTIVQMGALIAACIWGAKRWQERFARHAGIIAVMGFIVANLAFLVASLWGDVVGESLWGPRYGAFSGEYETYLQARDAFRASTFVISEHVFAVIWAIVLAGLVAWAAMGNRRGLFNTGMTFAGIHAYTQVFETFYDEPLAYVIAGLAAIPLAFGLWRLNQIWFGDDTSQTT